MFVDDLDQLGMRPEDTHHLGRVLRLRDGEAVAACDAAGSGAWRRCMWRSGQLVADGPVEAEPGVVAGGRRPAVAVGFVPTKGDRPEWVVQKLTEVGVDRIVVVMSERSVVRWEGERGGARVGKLVEVARQAAMQSRRVRVPVVQGPMGLDAVASGGESLRWGLAVPGGAVSEWGAVTAILVGPEGGWSQSEEGCGLPTLGLGDGVLRAETAAVVAGTLLCSLRAGVVRPAG